MDTAPHGATTRRSIRRGVVLALLAALVPLGAGAQGDYVWSDVERVVAVADVHGAYAELVGVLEAAGVIDADLSWSGGATHLVSLGDLLDRGPESRAVMDLLMRLQPEASAAGGHVHVILGNHELMNLIGDLRYVSAEEYAAFAADETDAMREEAYAVFVAELEARRAAEAAGAAAADVNGDSTGESTGAESAESANGTEPEDLRATFDERFPPGYFAHREAFSETGRYGSWLLGLPAIVVIDDTAFVHGGLPADVATRPLEEFNAALASDLQRFFDLRAELAEADIVPAFDTASDEQLARAALDAGDAPKPPALEPFVALLSSGPISVNGPLWYRGSVFCKPLFELPVLDEALARLGAERVVVGHTPTDDRRAQSIYEGRIIMLDTGMLASYYSGRPGALVIEGGRTEVLYTSPVETRAIEPTAGPGYYGLADAEILDALESGMTTGIARGTEGAAWQVELDYGGTKIRALFYPDDTGGDLELAAAALDDAILTDLVPPTVERNIEGTDGALQLVLSDAVTEARRLERRLPLGGWCPIEPQLGLLYAFDALTANHGRTAENLTFSRELSNLGVTDHGAAFGTERSLYPPGLDPLQLAIPDAVVEALRTLDEAGVEAELGQWLDRRRRRALLSRRDALIEGR